jgi:transcriptional regulator with XRE-family HTH domain
MSAEPTVPDWTLGWRLRRALDFAGVTVAEMADELGVGRTTVSGWLNDPDRHIRRVYLRYWADRCRVPLEWLEFGELPRVDSNHQPAGWGMDHSGAEQTGANVPVERLSRAEIKAFRFALKDALPPYDPPNGRPDPVRPARPSMADHPASQ